MEPTGKRDEQRLVPVLMETQEQWRSLPAGVVVPTQEHVGKHWGTVRATTKARGTQGLVWGIQRCPRPGHMRNAMTPGAKDDACGSHVGVKSDKGNVFVYASRASATDAVASSQSDTMWLWPSYFFVINLLFVCFLVLKVMILGLGRHLDRQREDERRLPEGQRHNQTKATYERTLSPTKTAWEPLSQPPSDALPALPTLPVAPPVTGLPEPVPETGT
ncbi:hypothetical protein B0H19DRAFT_1305678 [Mycena capillaripes]|nr:hypothetical protein B0H19DRAFT_1305678 [Mycena capillaripes]